MPRMFMREVARTPSPLLSRRIRVEDESKKTIQASTDHDFMGRGGKNRLSGPLFPPYRSISYFPYIDDFFSPEFVLGAFIHLCGLRGASTMVQPREMVRFSRQQEVEMIPCNSILKLLVVRTGRVIRVPLDRSICARIPAWEIQS